jgi:hypothetical protein
MYVAKFAEAIYVPIAAARYRAIVGAGKERK